MDGVGTRVAFEEETEGPEPAEQSWTWLALCPQSGSRSFGEHVDNCKNRVIVGHAGSWEAGVDDARPGMLMPGQPAVAAPGVAMDMAAVLSVSDHVSVPAGDFDGALHVTRPRPSSRAASARRTMDPVSGS